MTGNETIIKKRSAGEKARKTLSGKKRLHAAKVRRQKNDRIAQALQMALGHINHLSAQEINGQDRMINIDLLNAAIGFLLPSGGKQASHIWTRILLQPHDRVQDVLTSQGVTTLGGFVRKPYLNTLKLLLAEDIKESIALKLFYRMYHQLLKTSQE